MVEYMKENGYTRISEGALVVDVKEETDTKEIPPCMILKSNGATLYNTTDLATIVERMKLFAPNHIVYVVDKRQDLHFTQVFRTAKKAGIVGEDTKLTFMGFGTMNGKDGKPFKTRDGGVMRLSSMISEIQEEMYKKIVENHTVEEEEGRKTAGIVGIAALKYGDLSNQASKDYIFDMERFTSFEGNTGPYILYSVVRIKSILAKYEATGKTIADAKFLAPVSESEKSLMNTITGFAAMMETASAENAPHKVCAFIYDLANSFNHFYHETKILAEENADRQASYIALLDLTKRILETCVDLLGFEAPDRM
jgi:arginyl-tRNA synthetase